MMRFLATGTLFLIFIVPIYGQEKNDTLTINDGPKAILEERFSFDQAIRSFYPLSSPTVKNQQMLHQIFQYDDETINQLKYIVSPYNAFQYYSKNGFTFYQNSVPLLTGFSFHSMEAFDSKKVDFFVDGSGLLYNDYFPTDPNTIPGDTRSFIWELGAGAGYKINSKSTIFIKGSVMMNNLNPYGTKEIGGMKVKF